ncbi:MAG: DegT/DnrJ/EryC1/StrS family aminotransferase [Candidatus Brocadiales bacterium]|nr:DegT/DnrJ/EryC1/StrS family aminotransferase [Candidatus Brocadiales bacterium]
MKDSKLALYGGRKAINGDFPQWPLWDIREKIALEEVLNSSVWGLQGSAVPKFIEGFKQLQNVSYVLPVCNGTIALILALEALGVGLDDEVIIPDYTFMATAVAPLKVGAKPIIVDIDKDTFCLDPKKLEQAITKKTKAIIPVHFGGNICDMEAILKIASKHNLSVIEDSAHAHGASVNGKFAGSFGDIGTFSFQSSKTLSCGEGGAIVTNNKDIFSKIYSYHNCGRISDQPDYAHFLPGSNYRIGQFQAAILNAQMNNFPDQLERRDKNGKLLSELLSKIDGVKPQKRAENLDRHGHYLFTFILEADIPREPFKRALVAEGCLVDLEYPSIHTLEFMKPYVDPQREYPVSTLLADRSICLYHNALLGTAEQTEQIAKAIEKVLKQRDYLT